jgi:hypothetical protein
MGIDQLVISSAIQFHKDLFLSEFQRLYGTCSHKATLMAGTIMQATKLPLTTRIRTFYLIGQNKTSISSLVLSHRLEEKYGTVWLLGN